MPGLQQKSSSISTFMFVLVTLLFLAGGAHAQAPRFSEGGPDAEDYGASKGYPIGDRST